MEYYKNTKELRFVWKTKSGVKVKLFGILNSDGNTMNSYRFKSQNEYYIYTTKIVKI